MNTTNMEIARERQLEWLLGEVLGHAHIRTPRKKAPAIATRWLAAAIILLAIGTAIGVSVLNEDDDGAPTNNHELAPPEQPIDWHECHGPAALGTVPKDVVNLACFDFTDAAMRQLAQFEKLERLNFSGMDVNEQGYSVGLTITDAGVAHLASLSKLRWLSLGKCSRVTGRTLKELQALPLLEHLDLSSTAVTSEALATLPQMPSLRELSLSFCMDFHGKSLADIAKIPGLRRLDLSYCPTISAKDALHLTKLSELRYLDLSICCGAFLGQTAAVLDDVTGVEPPPPPKQDGIGITDEVVAALSALPLEHLMLGDCTALTNGIKDSLAKMQSLRTLDVSHLPKTTGAILTDLPLELRSLSLNNNHKYAAEHLRSIARLTKLTNLSVAGSNNLDDALLEEILAGKRLKGLAIGGMYEGMNDKVHRPNLTSACRTTLARQLDLESIDLSQSNWLDPRFMRELAHLPRLHTVTLQMAKVTALQLAALAESTSLQTLSLQGCRTMEITALRALKPARLKQAILYGTRFSEEDVLEVAKNWPGCSVVLPNARVVQIPN